MDREARENFDLLDEIADQLQLDVSPQVWPVGYGLNFRGIYDFAAEDFTVFDAALGENGHISKTDLAAHLSAEDLAKLKEEAELARGVLPRFDLAAYRGGMLTPVFFGSALKNFGVKNLLSMLARHAPSPRPQGSTRWR